MDVFRQTRVVLSEAPGLFVTSVVLVTLASGLYTAVPALQGAPMLYSLVVLALFAVGLPLCTRFLASGSALSGLAKALAFASEIRALRRRRASLELSIESELARVLKEDLHNALVMQREATHERRPARLEQRFVNVNRSLQDVIEAVRPVAGRAGVTVETQLADEPVFVEGNVFALGRACLNVILNAIEASGHGSVVTISSARVGDEVVIGIMDSLGGILADRLAVHSDLSTKQTFASALRSILRQDPDVILVGEIRDEEKSVEQVGGSISASSGVDGGFRFALRFPAIPQGRPSQIPARDSA